MSRRNVPKPLTGGWFTVRLRDDPLACVGVQAPDAETALATWLTRAGRCSGRRSDDVIVRVATDAEIAEYERRRRPRRPTVVTQETGLFDVAPYIRDTKRGGL